jgi:YggT family protein
VSRHRPATAAVAGIRAKTARPQYVAAAPARRVRFACRTIQPFTPTRTRAMNAIARLVDTVVTLYIWVLIAQAILSWLIAFNVINGYNQFVRGLGEFLWRITEPALRPLRRFVPAIGGVDVSPIVLILVLYFVRDLVLYDLFPALQ